MSNCPECKAPEGECWSQSGSMGGKHTCYRDEHPDTEPYGFYGREAKILVNDIMFLENEIESDAVEEVAQFSLARLALVKAYRAGMDEAAAMVEEHPKGILSIYSGGPNSPPGKVMVEVKPHHIATTIRKKINGIR